MALGGFGSQGVGSGNFGTGGAASGGGPPVPPPGVGGGISLFRKRSGEAQLRVKPINHTPSDGDWVYCLGHDLLAPPVEDYQLGDFVDVRQTITTGASDKFVKIQGRFRQPADLPIREGLPGSSTCSRSERVGLNVVDEASVSDGEFFTIDDGVNPVVTFEFDDNGSVVETATLRAITLAGGETAKDVRDLIVTAVNGAPTLDTTAAPAGDARVGFENNVGGGLTVVESVADAGFTVDTSVPDVVRVHTTTAFFDADNHTLRSIALVGGAIVDGTYRIHRVENSMTVVLVGEPLASASAPVAITGHVKGCHWKLRMFFDTTEIFAYEPGQDGLKKRDILMPDLRINVARHTSGSHEIEYQLELVETP